MDDKFKKPEHLAETAPFTEAQWNYLLAKSTPDFSPDDLEKALKKARQVEELKARLKRRYPKLKWIEAN